MRELGNKGITVFFGPTTHAALKKLAQAHGVTLAAFVRGCSSYFANGGFEISRLAVAQLRR